MLTMARLHANLGERVAYVIKLEGLDNGGNKFHIFSFAILLVRECAQNVFDTKMATCLSAQLVPSTV